MIHFTPTYGIKDTSKNIQSFVKENKSEFHRLLKTILPYLIVLVILSFAVSHFSMRQIFAGLENVGNVSQEEIAARIQTMNANALSLSNGYMWMHLVLQVFIGYLFAVMAISWHRLVILGSENYRPMNPFKPEKHEMEFVGVLMFISIVLPMIVGFVVSAFKIQTLLSPGPVILAVFMLAGLFIYVFFKISFFFPAKAVNAPISFATSFKLTKGYFWKFLWSVMRASLKTIGIMVLWVIAASIVGGILTHGFLGGEQANMAEAMKISLFTQFWVNLPILVYFQPLLMIIGVTGLSNYYQHAVRNKPEAYA